MSQFLGRALHNSFKHDAPIDFVVAVEHALERRARFFNRHLGQKSESAEIYAKDRNPLRRDQARDAEQRAVTAEHHDQVGAVAQLMPFDRLCANRF